ncbi:zinc ABC transporter substrate-binding protein [Rhodobacteraceae bacterium PA1-206B]
MLGLALAGPAQAEVPQVVTDIPPVHSLVASVMGDLGTPVLLLEKGASEHHFQLRPSQAGQIARADLVVLVSPRLTPWLDGALKNRPADAAVLELLEAKGTHLQDYGAQAADDHDEHDDDHDDHGHHDHDGGSHHDHAEDTHDHDDHAHDHDQGDHDGHDHSGTDPHAWLDPGNGRLWLVAIAAELSRLDPENAAHYAANAAAMAEMIESADAEARALLAPVRDKPFATAHDAWGYFATHYGLTSAGSVALGDASAPGARHLSALRARVEAGEILCLFPEAQHDPAHLTQLAEGSGARIGASLDPVGSTLEPGPALYADLLTGAAQSFADCLGD